MKTQVNKLNSFLLKLVKVVGFVSIAYLANLFVTEWFGGVNPLIEFSSVGLSKIESTDSKNRIGLGVAYHACKDNLSHSSDVYEFIDDSYQAWNLSGGRFLIQTRVYSTGDSGLPVAANLMCRLVKTEGEELLATNWQVQGIQLNIL